jgi:hypothetical protein
MDIQFALPATGSKYLPVLPVMYIMSPLSFTSTLAQIVEVLSDLLDFGCFRPL